MSRRSMRFPFLLLLCVLLLGACSHGMVKRVSEPAVSIQQLTVRGDGSWSIDLRLQNYSSIPMHFDSITLDLAMNDGEAGKLQQAVDISIGPESADVVTLALQPASIGKMSVADTLAGGRSLSYTLKGTVTATPQDKKQRDFKIDAQNWLNPAPGLPGVLR